MISYILMAQNLNDGQGAGSHLFILLLVFIFPQGIKHKLLKGSVTVGHPSPSSFSGSFFFPPPFLFPPPCSCFSLLPIHLSLFSTFFPKFCTSMFLEEGAL